MPSPPLKRQVWICRRNLSGLFFPWKRVHPVEEIPNNESIKILETDSHYGLESDSRLWSTQQRRVNPKGTRGRKAIT